MTILGQFRLMLPGSFVPDGNQVAAIRVAK